VDYAGAAGALLPLLQWGCIVAILVGMIFCTS
jgi:hypothetical protein